MVRQRRYRKKYRYRHLRPDRQGQQLRSDRGSDGHHPARDHLSISAAVSRMAANSRRYRPADPPAAACRNHFWTPRSITIHSMKPDQLWAPAAWWSWMRRPVWSTWPAISSILPKSNPAANACRAGSVPNSCLIFSRISAQEKARREDIELLVELSHSVHGGSVCGLGQTAANPGPDDHTLFQG